MIEKITSFSNIKTKALTKFHSITKSIRFDMPILKELKQDIIELKQGMPEVLLNNPKIVEGKYINAIEDKRFSLFGAEYRAYNYEGYSNKFPNNYVCIDSNGDRRLKPHIYLHIVKIKPEFARQGAYKNAVKRLYEISKDEGCEGRIILYSGKPFGDNSFPNPALIHWKCGFRFVKEENNKIMERVLSGELKPEDAPMGSMYYSLV